MMILGFSGAVIGAIIAQFIDVAILKIIFGVICIASTVVLVLIKSPTSLDNIKTEGVYVLSCEGIDQYLISYNMLKEEYSVDDLERLLEKIKNDVYSDKNNKKLVKDNK